MSVVKFTFRRSKIASMLSVGRRALRTALLRARIDLRDSGLGVAFVSYLGKSSGIGLGGGARGFSSRDSVAGAAAKLERYGYGVNGVGGGECGNEVFVSGEGEGEAKGHSRLMPA
jgi:hypothetical protein